MTEHKVEYVEQSVQTRCPAMGRHEAGDLPVPCPDCYSVRVTSERLPWQPPVRWEHLTRPGGSSDD